MEDKKLRYSVCIDAVFRSSDRSFVQAMHEVAALGYDAFEFWSWQDKDLGEIRRASRDTGLQTAAFCTVMRNPGDRTQQEAYLEGVKQSVEAAQSLDCLALIMQAGWEYETAAKGIARQEHRRVLTETLCRAGELAAAGGVTLLLEPLNLRVDHPGYHLWSSEDAFDLLDKVGNPHVKLLFDIYHQQVTEGDLTSHILPNIDKIGHFHAAAVPGRGEPTDGEINYRYLFRRIAESGYGGFVGLEYMTQDEPSESLRRVWEVCW